MQTFLPYGPDFGKTAKVLDYRRLGKQRVEVKQIVLALRDDGGWKHHPAVRQWAGYETALLLYGRTMCVEWCNRGFNDKLLHWMDEQLSDLSGLRSRYPEWLWDPRLALSHQANLIRKDPDYYRVWFPGVDANMPYWWPSKDKDYADL